MKYYKISIKRYYGERIASNANFIDSLKDEYFKQISVAEIILNAPIFDYFYLESFDEKEYWEWNLFDIHQFTGDASRMLGSLLISSNVKKILGQFRLAEPHCYYASKLLYKGEKLDYYIFQYTGKSTYKKVASYINFEKSEFLNPITNTLTNFKDIDDYSRNSEQLYFQSDSDFEIKIITLKKAVDFYPMQSFLQDNLVSERLKQAIEDNGITGFEFSELDYEVVVEKG